MLSCASATIQPIRLIHIIRRLIYKFREIKRIIHMVFIYLEKAYDNSTSHQQSDFKNLWKKFF